MFHTYNLVCRTTVEYTSDLELWKKSVRGVDDVLYCIQHLVYDIIIMTWYDRELHVRNCE